MWKTRDGYTLTMPQSELEALAAEFSGSGCGCKGCAVDAVTRELDHYISTLRRMPKRFSAAHKRAHRSKHRKQLSRSSATKAPAHTHRSAGAPGSASQGGSDTFAGRAGNSNYQFQTKRLPGNRRLIYAYTPPPWAYRPPPPPPPECSPDDPYCGQAPDPGDADDGSGSPDDGSSDGNGDTGELSGTVLGALLRGR